MDPLSVISGVAGVATAAASLASSLHSLISDIRDAPREMRDMAGGVRELSDVLRELRGALRKGEGLFRRKLYRSIATTTARIKELHTDISGLVAFSGGMSRVLWALRSKAKAERLVGRIDSLKLGLLLQLKTMSLALVIENTRTKGKDQGQDQDDDRAFHRMQLEMLVQTAKQSIRDAATAPPTTRDFGTQTDNLSPSPSSSKSTPVSTGTITAEARKIDSEESQVEERYFQIQKWDNAPEDFARLLYRLVFQDLKHYDPKSPQMDVVRGEMSTGDMVLASEALSQRQAADRMLLAYSYLEPEDIEESEDEQDYGKEPLLAAEDFTYPLTDSSTDSIFPSDSRSLASDDEEQRNSWKSKPELDPIQADDRYKKKHTYQNDQEREEEEEELSRESARRRRRRIRRDAERLREDPDEEASRLAKAMRRADSAKNKARVKERETRKQPKMETEAERSYQPSTTFTKARKYHPVVISEKPHPNGRDILIATEDVPCTGSDCRHCSKRPSKPDSTRTRSKEGGIIIGYEQNLAY